MNSGRPLSRWLLTVLMTVALAAACLGLIFAGKAVILLLIIAVFALIALSFFKDLEQMAFLFLAATLPIRLTVHITESISYERAHSAFGFVVSLTDCLIIVLMIAWARRVLFFDQPIRWYPRVSVPMLLLAAWVFQAGLRAEDDPISGAWMILRFFECWGLFLYLVNNIRPIRDYLLHSIATCGMLVFESLLGLGQDLTGGNNFGMEIFGAPVKRSNEGDGSRCVGTLPTPNLFASILSLFIVHPISLLFSNLKKHKWIYFGVIMVTCVTILGTKSRGVWLSSTLVFGFGLFQVLRMRLAGFRAAMSMGWAMIVIGVVALSAPGVYSRLTEDDHGSAESRIYMNQIAFNMVQDKPFFGFGWDNYTIYFNGYDDTDIQHSYDFPFIVHNGYAYIAVEYGVPALFLLLAIWLSVMKRTLRWRPAGYEFQQMLAFFMPWVFVGRMIQSPLYVNNPLNSLDVWYALAMCVVFQEWTARDEEMRARGEQPPSLALAS
jgi:O-antigen ligase/polysaccharide polymerase Wzy-like membrane protein